MIKRYCQTSTKYSLYCFQKFLIPSKIPITFFFIFLLSFSVNAQLYDTLSLKFKKTKLLIVNKHDTNNEWSFEEEEQKDKKKENNLQFMVTSGLFHLNSKLVFSGIEKTDIIPCNQVNSNTQGLTFYWKNLTLKNSLKLSFGAGFNIQRLNLGMHRTFLTKDSLYFRFDQQFNNNRNVLKFNQWILPIALYFPIKNKIFAHLELKNHFINNAKLDVKTIENKIMNRVITKEKFFQKRYYASFKTSIIYQSIGFFFESSLSSNSTLFKNQFNYSFGILLCKYR
tara:strand:+ start:22743 stop:23588 length:846 start_codon:yes stop_codon:yes gene_type:complete